MDFFKKTLAAAALICAPLTVHANAVDLTAEGYAATATVFSFGPIDTAVVAGSFSAFDLATLSAINGGTATDVSTYSISLGGATPFDAINASVGINANFGPTPLEMIFNNVLATGSFAAADGEAILLSLNDPGLTFTDGYTGSAQGFSVTVLEALAPIPLPAGGLLLLSAGGAMVALRRRAKS